MFATTQIYTVHTDPKADEPLESAELIREGFNVFAFAFMGLWVLYHRMWALFVALLLVDVALVFLSVYFGVAPVIISVLRFGFQAWFGFSANDFRRQQLEREGYMFCDITSGENQVRATQRFFDRLTQQPQNA